MEKLEWEGQKLVGKGESVCGAVSPLLDVVARLVRRDAGERSEAREVEALVAGVLEEFGTLPACCGGGVREGMEFGREGNGAVIVEEMMDRVRVGEVGGGDGDDNWPLTGTGGSWGNFV